MKVIIGLSSSIHRSPRWRSTLAFVILLIALFFSRQNEMRSTAQSGAGADAPTVWEQAQAAEYQAVWQEPPGRLAGYYAPNRRHNILSVFTMYGAYLSPRTAEGRADWFWALRPSAVGPEGAPIPLPASARAVRAAGPRVEIEWGDLLSEWYLNEERGVEHGFVIHQRRSAERSRRSPTSLLNGDPARPLAVEMRLVTNLLPSPEGGEEILFRDGAGAAILRYAELHVFDAHGRALPARFALKRSNPGETATTILSEDHALVEDVATYTLSILINEQGARYPITVDPLITGQERQLTASDGTSGDQFGASVALSGDTLVVGAPNADVGINVAQGAAYIFQRTPGGANAWGEVKRLTAGDGAAFDNFGGAVAIAGDVIVVGATGDNVAENTDQGAAYLFGRNHGGQGAWGQVKKLLAGDGAPFDRFGAAVAVSGDSAAVGASGANVDGRLDQGAAYLFGRNQDGADAWGEIKKIVALNGAAGAFFGAAAAIQGETLAVGAPAAQVGEKPGQGAAYVFSRDQGGLNAWGETARLTASDGAPFDSFGVAAAIDGARILIGASDADVQGKSNQGAAYLFQRDQGGAGSWREVKKLLATGGVSNDHFGDAVALDADTVMVGARASNISIENDQGSAYLFERDHGGVAVWGQLTRITGSDGAANDSFGAAVAVAGSVFVAGAPGKDVDDDVDMGAAYVFDLQISRLADLRIEKNVAPASALPGAFITYTLGFQNDGPGGAIEIRIGDALPTNLSVASIITNVVGQGVRILQTGQPPNLSWSVPWLDRNDGGAIVIVGQILDDPALAGLTLSNTAAITATNDITPFNNTSSAMVTVLPPPGRLTVTKLVVNDNGGTKQPGDFPLFVNGAPLVSGRAMTLSAGVYTVTETSGAGYQAAFQGDCNDKGTVMLAPGDAKSCTVVNDDQPASLTVNKVVINDNGGSKQAGDFLLFIDGTPAMWGAAVMLDAGTYTVSEASSAGYTASFSGDCDALGRVTLAVGEAKACTLTNDDYLVESFIYLPLVMQ